MTTDEYELAAKFIDTVEASTYDWSVTLTTHRLIYPVVKMHFDAWISRVQSEDGATDWLRVTEPGDDDSISLHVFIGGRRWRYRGKWMRVWEELSGGTARTRFLGDTERLRGLLGYFVLRRFFAFKTRSKRGRDLDIKGWSE